MNEQKRMIGPCNGTEKTKGLNKQTDQKLLQNRREQSTHNRAIYQSWTRAETGLQSKQKVHGWRSNQNKTWKHEHT